MPGEKVAVVGHSFVNHLRDFVREDLFTDDSFGYRNAEVRFFGVSGLTIGKLRRIERRMQLFRPEIVIVILGDNDIKDGVDPAILSLRLVAAVAMIQRWAGNAKVIKIDLFPRFWVPSYKYFCADYEQVAMAINAEFREQLEGVQNIFAWSCRGLCFHDARSENWKADGVHLLAAGNSLLYQGIKKALQVFKHM